MPAEIPEWVNETPEECTYDLTMDDGDGSNIQDVELTRDEYLALKKHLAAMRGYTVPEFRTLIGNGPEGYNASDEQQVASHLETARDWYLHCPELVVFQSDELDALLAKLAE